MTVIASTVARNPANDLGRELDEVRGKYLALLAECKQLRAKLNNRRKLTAADVAHIRDQWGEGQTQRSIASAWDINPATVSRIVRGLYHRA